MIEPEGIRLIYADNAATTKLDIDAFEAMKNYLVDSYGNPSQPYSFSRNTRKALKDSREVIAACINASPEEIFFTSGGTESDNWALKGYVQKSNVNNVIISAIEHHAVLHTADALKREGYDVCILDVTHEGVVLPSTLEIRLNGSASLVSIMMANNEIGSIQPISELTRVSHEQGAVFHTDAVQAVGHIEIDVKKLNVDMLSASAHKFNGPKGIGFLYIKKGIELYPFMDGGAQEKAMRAGTENIPAIVGMAVALKKNCDSIMVENRRLLGLEKTLIKALEQNNLQFIRNGADDHLPGNISLSFKDADGEMLLHRLDLMGISVSTGSACDSKNTQVSHVIKAIGIPGEYAKGTIRISLGRENTEEDVIAIVSALSKVLS